MKEGYTKSWLKVVENKMGKTEEQKEKINMIDLFSEVYFYTTQQDTQNTVPVGVIQVIVGVAVDNNFVTVQMSQLA